MGRVNLCTQHHTVLSLERSLSVSAVGYLHSSGSVLADSCVKGCAVCAHTLVRFVLTYNVLCVRLSTDHCFSMFQHATHTIVVLDTAWPWAGEAYTGFAVCAYTFVRSVVPQVGIAMGLLLQIRLSWLRALSKGCRCWCWCCGPRCWCCELAERAFKTGGGAGRALVPLPVLSAGKAHRCWCQLVVRAVEVP